MEALFLSAVASLGGRSVGPAYAELEAAYLRRAYHNLAHVEHALGTFLLLAKGLDARESARAVLGLCYHDAVYDPRARDNEAQSALLARRSLAPLGVGEADLAEIERLILLTRDHRASDPVGTRVIDADLAILQGSPERYDAYAVAIREEYAFVPDDEYRVGRRRVLEGLLERRLFTSRLLDEAAARANIAREIERLG